MTILEAIDECTFSANIDGVSTSVVDKERLVELIESGEVSDIKELLD